MLQVDTVLGVSMLSCMLVYYLGKKALNNKRVIANTINSKLSRNIDHINDESLTMMTTIKMFSKEHVQLADLSDAVNR